MRRRYFLKTASAGVFARLHSVPTLANQTAGDPSAGFGYRGWSFSVSGDFPLLERYVIEAASRAAAYGINTFELHDYVFPGRGLVEASIQYRAFPRLAQKEVLTYGSRRVSRAEREHDYERLRGLARKIKRHGLALNCWYHVMRDAPAELLSEYPEDSGLFWRYLDETLREFFARIPEADRLTITSLHETPSILSSTAAMGSEERLLRLYTTLHGACVRAGKEIVIRDFIVRAEDFESFWRTIERLPSDIYIMTKDVLAAWIHIGMPPECVPAALPWAQADCRVRLIW